MSVPTYRRNRLSRRGRRGIGRQPGRADGWVEHYNVQHMSSPSILVADDDASFEVFRAALNTDLPLTRVATLEQARRALGEPPSLVVCGCHFDEGRMYDLLRHLKASPELARVPFVAVRCVQDDLLDDALYESVKIAVRALGGNAFVDLLRWKRRWGQTEAGHRLTQLVNTLAHSPPADTDPVPGVD
jgi:CheY-like chemotaxis protein